MRTALENPNIMYMVTHLVEAMEQHGTKIDMETGEIADLETPAGASLAMEKMGEMTGNHSMCAYEHNGLIAAINQAAGYVATERKNVILTTAGMAAVYDILADMDEEIAMEEAAEPELD